jgi:hypothetical protein
LIPESRIVSVGRDSLLVLDSKDLSAGAVVERGATVVVGGATVEVVVSGNAVIVEGATVVVFVAVVVLGLLFVELLVELQQKMLVQKGIFGNCGTGFCGTKKPKGLVHQFIQSVAEDDQTCLLLVVPAAFKLKEGKGKRF